MPDNTISVRSLQDKLRNKENIFILDVRPSDQRKEWKIVDSHHVDAYLPLNAGDDTALDSVSIPDNATVVTVCAAGRTSLLASNLLSRKGITAYSLEGGMKAWNYAWSTAENTANGVKVVQVRRLSKGVLSYIVGSGNEAVVIDASLDPEIYQQIADQNSWVIKYVTDTHIHADFVSRTRELASATNAKHLAIENTANEFDFIRVPKDKVIPFGQSEMHFIPTPGHTWESVTLQIDNLLFTGDTLFIDGIGRPDLKAEKKEAIDRAKALYQTLNIILAFPPELVVLPAHTSTSIPFNSEIIADSVKNIKERIKLPATESEFVDYTLSRIPPTPPNYMTIAALNRKGSYEGQVLADLEAGGNHCALV